MRIQSINNNYNGFQQNFGANKLKTLTIGAKNLKKQNTIVDIYSITKNDSEFVNSLLEKVKIREITDKSAIAEKTNINNALEYAFSRVKHINENDRHESCIVAVENGNKVIGLLNYLSHDLPFLKNLIVWEQKNSNLIRTALLTQFLNKAERMNRNRHCSNFKDAIAFTAPKTKASSMLSKYGFERQKGSIQIARDRMTIKAHNIKNALKSAVQDIKNNGNVQLKSIVKPEKVSLQDLEI